MAMSTNAVVGIDLDYEVVSTQGAMLMVSISDTALVVPQQRTGTGAPHEQQ